MTDQRIKEIMYWMFSGKGNLQKKKFTFNTNLYSGYFKNKIFFDELNGILPLVKKIYSLSVLNCK